VTRRAAFLAAIALGTALTAGPHPGAAQQAGKVFRIGILSPAPRPDTAVFDAFRKGLAELGYIEGQNIRIEYRLAAGDIGRLPAMAGELVRLPVDVIVTDGGPKVAQIALDATRTIPIVGATLGADPVAAGLAASFAHPGGNVTGLAGFVELSGKRVQLLKEVLPAASRIGALWNPTASVPLISPLRATEESARALGLQLRPIAIATPDQIPHSKEAARVRGDSRTHPGEPWGSQPGGG
jgi:putative tryptophan/tyrosine transport system substrate-binding protein